MFGFAWNINLWHVKFIELILSKNKYNINVIGGFVFYFYYGDHVKNQKNSSFFYIFRRCLMEIYKKKSLKG